MQQFAARGALSAERARRTGLDFQAQPVVFVIAAARCGSIIDYQSDNRKN
jgi:hypothetical protein